MLAAGGPAGAGGVAGAELTAPELRDAMARMARAVDTKDAPIGRVENYAIPGPGGPIALRGYAPQSAVDALSGGIVYFHGGMGVFNSVETHEGACRMLANASGARVLSVEYWSRAGTSVSGRRRRCVGRDGVGIRARPGAWH